MNDISFGRRLKTLRKRAQLTQVDAARLIHISYKSIQDHEGGRWPNKNNLEKYIEFYGCDRNWLLTGIGEPYIKKDREENNIPQLRKSVEEYKIGTPRLGQAVDMLATILESGNDALIHSLISHLIASKEAVHQMRQQNQQLSALQSELDAVRKRLAALEEKSRKNKEAEKEENIEKKAM